MKLSDLIKVFKRHDKVLFKLTGIGGKRNIARLSLRTLLIPSKPCSKKMSSYGQK